MLYCSLGFDQVSSFINVYLPALPHVGNLVRHQCSTYVVEQILIDVNISSIHIIVSRG